MSKIVRWARFIYLFCTKQKTTSAMAVRSLSSACLALTDPVYFYRRASVPVVFKLISRWNVPNHFGNKNGAKIINTKWFVRKNVLDDFSDFWKFVKKTLKKMPKTFMKSMFLSYMWIQWSSLSFQWQFSDPFSESSLLSSSCCKQKTNRTRKSTLTHTSESN